MHEYVHVSPTSNNELALPSPDTNPGGHNGSATVTADNVTFPSFTTVTV